MIFDDMIVVAYSSALLYLHLPQLEDVEFAA
jgi:hypothetical protein